MIKRILVALDPDLDTNTAIRYASELARRTNAEVTGLALVDMQHIATSVGPGGAIGGLYYAEKVKQSLSEETRAMARDLVGAFDAALKEAGVRHGERIEEGVPAQQIVEELRYHDLLVVGKDPHFFYANPEHRTHTLARVVKSGVAPTLAVGTTHRPVERVLIAYDGSDASASTMQRFAQLLPFGTDLEIEVVHICTTRRSQALNTSKLMVRLAAAYLRAHGFAHVREASMDSGSPGPRIVDHATTIGADLVVAGAHSVSAARRLAFGSTTHHLLTDVPVPLWVYH